MNTQGWIRGLMSKNMDINKFCDFILNTIKQEFLLQGNLIKKSHSYIFVIDKYKIEIEKEKIFILQKRSPYSLDKYILEELRKQDFQFDNNRSQYIKYCYGIFN